MGRMRPTILLVAIASGSGCQQAPRRDVADDDLLAKITYRVFGMLKAKSGAT